MEKISNSSPAIKTENGRTLVWSWYLGKYREIALIEVEK